MDALNIELDFTNVSAAGGLGTLPAGLHEGTLVEFKHFPDTNRLYVYMLTRGVRHRESFGLENPNSLPFLKAFLLSAGIAEGKLSSKGKIPFHKLGGRKVYFQYTPAQTDSNGKRMEGSYARYVFYPESQWEQMAAYANASDEDVVIEKPTNGVSAAPTNGAGKASKAKAKAKSDSGEEDDFDFLLDDDDE
jgi:hypothetical protein